MAEAGRDGGDRRHLRVDPATARANRGEAEVRRLKALIDRLGKSVVGRAAGRYGRANGGTWAINIAWNLLFAFFPIVLITLTVAGLITTGGSTAQHSIQSGIASLLPGQQGQLLVQALDSFRRSAGILVVVSFAGLVWSGTSLFSAMDQSLDMMGSGKTRGFIGQHLMAMGMIAIVTVLILVAVGTSTLLSVIGGISQIPGWIAHGAGGILLQLLVGALDFFLMMLAIYMIVPRRRPSWRAGLIGAGVAGGLLELFTLLFPLYFHLQHGFSSYGSTFALFFLLMTYAYFLAQIIVLVGALTAELDGAPEPAAPPPRLAKEDHSQQAGPGALTPTTSPHDSAR